MYRDLFALAGPAIVGWLLLIFLPGWRGSRWLGSSLLFPVYLSLLYLVGIVPIVAAAGPRIMADFGNLNGVLGLLAREEVALIAWIHILAFDHLVGVFIYRDNMRHRFVPLPAQSIILFMTLMFGPVGFLTYGAIRAVRTRRRPLESNAAAPAAAGAGGSSVIAFVPAAVAWLRREPLISALGVTGILLGAVCLAAIPFLGVEVPPEGHLLDTATFNLGLGFFVLTLAAVLPLSGYARPGGRRWRWFMSALLIYFYAIETVQTFRGLDPRFTRHGGVVDQIAGALFGLTALAMIVTVTMLGVSFFRNRRNDLLTISIRYGFAAVGLAFIVGLWMSIIQGRLVGAAGNLLPAHGVGFHGIQAVPLVALLLMRTSLSERKARRLVHVAGGAWILACLALLAQAAAGAAPMELTITAGIATLSITTWTLALLTAAGLWLRAPAPEAVAR